MNCPKEIAVSRGATPPLESSEVEPVDLAWMLGRLEIREGIMSVRMLAVAAASAIVFASLPDAAGAQMQEVMRYCKPDIERLCPGIQPGGGRIAQCLKAHKMEVSVGCAKTLQKMKAQMGK